MDAFIENANNSDFDWLTCNFPGTGKYENAFFHEPYKVLEVGKHHIALLGIEYDKKTDAYAGKVKKAITDAIAEGADYVIAVGHTGEDTKEIIENTAGIDIYLNAHDHAVNDAKEQALSYQNIEGENVPVYETGTGFQYTGKLVLDCESEEIQYSFELKTADDLESEIAESISDS